MPTFSRTYLLPVIVGIVSSLAATYASISLAPLLLAMAPREDFPALAASWLPVLLGAAPSLLVGFVSIKRPMLLGFISALTAAILFFALVTLRSISPTHPATLFGLFNTACQGALYGGFFACAGYAMGSNYALKRTVRDEVSR